MSYESEVANIEGKRTYVKWTPKGSKSKYSPHIGAKQKAKGLKKLAKEVKP